MEGGRSREGYEGMRLVESDAAWCGDQSIFVVTIVHSFNHPSKRIIAAPTSSGS